MSPGDVYGIFPGKNDFINSVCLFHAKASSNLGVPAGTFTKVRYDVEFFDMGNVYDPVLYRFTPVRGFVWIAAGLANIPTNNVHYFALYKNGVRVYQNGRRPFNSTIPQNNVLWWIDWANGGDYYEVYFYSFVATTINADDSYFEGYTIQPQGVLLQDYERNII